MNLYSITLDTDWAPDFVMEEVAEVLIKNKVKSTWFVSHKSKFIDQLSIYSDLIELGLHPNYLPNSSHGQTSAEILKTAQSIVPDSHIIRTHALVQSSHLLYEWVKDFGITADFSIFLRESANIEPHIVYFEDKPLIRCPFFWEDDTNTVVPDKTWDFSDPRYHFSGLKIFNFHPMYIYLNCDVMDGYFTLKKIRYLPEITQAEMEPYINYNKGTNTFFTDLVKYISKKGVSYKASEIIELWKKNTAKGFSLNTNLNG